MLSFSAIGMPLQRAADSSLGPLAIELVGLFERPRVDDNRRVQAILVQPEPRQVLTDELTRGELTTRHGVAHLLDRRFDDAEGRPLSANDEHRREKGYDGQRQRALHRVNLSERWRGGLACPPLRAPVRTRAY